jgi:hypothetical protein
MYAINSFTIKISCSIFVTFINNNYSFLYVQQIN